MNGLKEFKEEILVDHADKLSQSKVLLAQQIELSDRKYAQCTLQCSVVVLCWSVVWCGVVYCVGVQLNSVAWIGVLWCVGVEWSKVLFSVS